MARLLVVQRDSCVDPMVRKLQEAGTVHIEHAPDYSSALGVLESRPFDALLTSTTTSVEADLEFLKHARDYRPAIRAVLLARSATADEVLAALRAQVYAVFTEPFDADKIVDLVGKATQDAESGGIQVISAAPHWITLRVRARLLTAERVMAFLDELHGRLIQGDQRDELIVAVREILLNAIEHGAGFDAEKEVVITAIRSKQSLFFLLRDPGPGFQADRLPQAAKDADPMAHMEFREEAGLRPGGFGMMVARQSVDEVIYNEQGNEVLLVKHLQLSS